MQNRNSKVENSTSASLEQNGLLAEVPGGLNDLACSVYEKNCKKWEYPPTRNIGEILCLIHSEVSEALEADRKHKYCHMNAADMVNRFKDDVFKDEYKTFVKGTFEEEMADIFIRLIDLCAYKGVDIEAHVKAKLKFTFMNDTEDKKY